MGTLLRIILITSGLFVASSAACYNGDRVQIDNSCKDYIECENGHFVRKSCGPLHLFDPKTLECRLSWKVDCLNKSIECEDDKVYPHPDSCRLYYGCSGGKLMLKFCPLLEVFDSSNSNATSSPCRLGWSCDKAECSASDRRPVAGDCSSFQECSKGAWETKSCPSGYSYNPNTVMCEMGDCQQCPQGESTTGTSCRKYLYCDLGSWVEKSCSMFKKYDPSKKTCVWFFQYSCPSASSFLAAETCTDGELMAEDDDCSKYSICDNGVWQSANCTEGFLFDYLKNKCVAREIAKCKNCENDIADEESCRSYYTCEKGQRVKKSCGFMKKFDGVTKSCVYFNAHCFPGDVCTSGKVATDDCKVYEECIDGRYYKQTCGKSRIFDAEKSKCVWTWPWRSCPAKNKTVAECNEGDTRLLSCDKYLLCEEGQWKQQTCSQGTTFLGKKCVKQTCDVAVLDCRRYSINGVVLECLEGEVFDKNSIMCVPGECQRVKRSTDEVCQDGERMAVEGDCKKFMECNDGQFVVKSCADCLNFDPEKKTCTFVWNLPCKSLVTTEHPQTQTETPATQTDTTTTQADTTTTQTNSPATDTPGIDTPVTDTPVTDTPATQTDTPATQTDTPVTNTPATQTDTPATQTDTPATQTDTPPTQTDLTTTTSPAPADCTEGMKKPDKENCRNYFTCEKGKWENHSCVWPWKFDSVDLKCEMWGARCA